MISQTQWEAMTPGEQEAAWMDELAGMLEEARQEFLGSLSAGAGTQVHAGAFNIVVTGGAEP